VITDGGQVLNYSVDVTPEAAPGNAVVVSGPGSVFSNSSFSGGSLIISNGGQVVSGNANVSSAQVTGVGSVWSVSGQMSFGYDPASAMTPPPW
jgi:hypothetical protein